MTMPIIATKVHVPRPPKSLVPRSRLVARLDAGRGDKLILVSAPAGFGKTSLLAEWAQQCMGECLVSWLHLDSGDGELSRFLTYLIAALQTHQEDIGEAASSGMLSMPPAPMEAVLGSLVNDLDSLERDLMLVLDDYHLIEAKPIHEAVGFLIEHLPERVCLVIATRTDPPLALHRLRGRGQVTEIRAQDLRFSSQETRRFLEGILQAELAEGDIDSLEDRVEGWAAGLQMAALSMQGSQDVHQFIESFSGSHRYIMDYLTEEIFNLQPDDIQEFLLKTSILERLSGPLCDHLLSKNEHEQTTAAQDMLEYLEGANLFLLPMDEERCWYRYHNLFASLLRQRLRDTWPGEVEGLQRRAAEWFAANGYIDEAITYAYSAGDMQLAADIAAENGLEYLKRGAVTSLVSWFRDMPEEMIKKRPWLSVIYSWIMMLTGKAELIESYLSAARQGAKRSNNSHWLRGNIAAIQAYTTASAGDVEQAIEEANTALELLPPDDLATRSVVAFTLGGVYYLQGEMSKSANAMEEASRYGERSGNINVAVSALNAMGGILMNQGRIREAEEAYGRGLQLGTGSSGRPLPMAASIYAGYARLALAREDFQNARQYAETGLELSEQWIIVDSQINCLLALAQVAQVEGDLAESQSAMEQARHLATTNVLMPGTMELIQNIESQVKAQSSGRTPQSQLVEPLSERELEVLRLMAQGRSNPEIAAELIIALGTVKAHTSSIYRKLDVRSRTEAVVKAGELGLV